MVIVVTQPDRKTQFNKTPAKKRIIEEFTRQEEKVVGLNPDGSPIIETITIKEKTPRWIEAIEGSGEQARILKWNEWLSQVRDCVQTKTVIDLKALYEKFAGEPYTGTETKRDVVLALIKLYFGIDVSGTISKILTQLSELIVRQGRWGLGCPYRCGRCWEFQPNADLSKFEPVDPPASSGQDVEGKPTKGYLQWQPQPDGSVKFICDNCGGDITLGP